MTANNRIDICTGALEEIKAIESLTVLKIYEIEKELTGINSKIIVEIAKRELKELNRTLNSYKNKKEQLLDEIVKCRKMEGDTK